MFCCQGEEELKGSPANKYSTALPKGRNQIGGAGSGRGEPRTFNVVKIGGPLKVLPIEIPAIPLFELNIITDNFGTKALIREGSYGLSFLWKLSVVSRLNNQHLVEMEMEMLGYCLDANNIILVYEHTTMGSLHDLLHGRKGLQGAKPGPVLTWN
ncbi:hypothetical protein PTKIN_Ptkin06aG0105800 [Pterospermum kingtungense]